MNKQQLVNRLKPVIRTQFAPFFKLSEQDVGEIATEAADVAFRLDDARPELRGSSKRELERKLKPRDFARLSEAIQQIVVRRAGQARA